MLNERITCSGRESRRETLVSRVPGPRLWRTGRRGELSGEKGVFSELREGSGPDGKGGRTARAEEQDPEAVEKQIFRGRESSTSRGSKDTIRLRTIFSNAETDAREEGSPRPQRGLLTPSAPRRAASLEVREEG